MIRVRTGFLAEAVVTDRDTNQISAFGLIEEIQAASFPTSMPRMALFCAWERALTDSPEHRVEVSVTLNGRDLARQSIDINFAQFLRTRATMRFEGLTLAEPGNLVFRLAIPGHDTAEWTLAALRKAPETRGAAHPGARPVYDSGQVSISVGSANVNRR
jgi:hypothetical protein